MFDNSISTYDWLCFGLFDSLTIIRCKDCKKRNTNDCPAYWEHLVYTEDCDREWEIMDNTYDNFFCAHGELRKSNS